MDVIQKASYTAPRVVLVLPRWLYFGSYLQLNFQFGPKEKERQVTLMKWSSSPPCRVWRFVVSFYMVVKFFWLFLEEGCSCEIFHAISCGLRILLPRFLVPFNLGVHGCNGWFTIGVYMFLVSISFEFGL